MKACVFAILLQLSVPVYLAQNANLDFKKAFKIYNLTSYDRDITFVNDTTIFSARNQTLSFHILKPTIAFQWKSKKNNFHEIELTNFTLSRVQSKTDLINDTSGKVQASLGKNTFNNTMISIRYEYVVNFFKNRDSRFVPSLGFSLAPYFKHNDYSPTANNIYAYSETLTGVKSYLIPRLSYYLSSRVFLDINLPLSVSDINLRTVQNENPAIPALQKRVSNFDLEIFPKQFSGRIGVGFKL